MLDDDSTKLIWRVIKTLSFDNFYKLIADIIRWVRDLINQMNLLD